MHVVVDEMNDGSSDEFIFVLMQIQNTMFCDIICNHPSDANHGTLDRQ